MIKIKRKNIVKSKKLDRWNKLLMVKDGNLYRVVSIKRAKWIGWIIGWQLSEDSLDYTTDLKGSKIVDGEYKGFENKELADKWMEFQASRFGKRIKFIGA